ncbi:MAG: hypothetical protein FWC41_07980, partial [Firmicutes bacterium]|nr:hypothetical protein [Bacillota bacterium]
MAFFGGKKVASLFVAFSTIFSASFGTKAIANDTTKKNNTSISNPKKKKVEPKSDSEPLLGP